MLIEEKLSLFCELYPSVRLIPKQHYMMYYSSQIKNFGPLLHSWTMRQEVKLSFIKRISCMSNFKNVCKTATKKHQFWLCYQLLSNFGSLLVQALELSSTSNTALLENEPDYVQAEFLKMASLFTPNTTVNHL